MCLSLCLSVSLSVCDSFASLLWHSCAGFCVVVAMSLLIGYPAYKQSQSTVIPGVCVNLDLHSMSYRPGYAVVQSVVAL